MLILSAGATFAGISTIQEYLSFPTTVIYSTGMIALIFSFLIVLPLCLAAFYSSVKGLRLPERNSLILFKMFIISVIVSILLGFLFKFYYMHEIEDREYVACKGIPTGWMPGMATKYVINKNLCHKK